MTDSNGGQIGIAILGAISAFSIWSAVNPSFFTLKRFADDGESDHHIYFGMNVGLVLDLALSAGLWLGYGKKGKWPAVFTAVTGFGLWMSYHYMLKNRSG